MATRSASTSTRAPPTSSFRRRNWKSGARKLFSKGGYPIPESQTPWQEIFRANVDQLSEGMVLKPAIRYQKIAKTKGLPRDNH